MRDTPPAAWDRASLEAAGFLGFTPLTRLVASDIPPERGAYLVTRPQGSDPTFLVNNPMTWNRSRAASYEVDDLTQRWIGDCSVVYIGVAAGIQGLRQRLLQFAAMNSSHSGGRSIWQLADSASLLVSWKVAEDARTLEDQLLRAFILDHDGRKPFANRAGPRRIRS